MTIFSLVLYVLAVILVCILYYHLSNFLLDCLKGKKIDKFHLLGHSMGGMIAQEMVKSEGNKISKLVCYSTGPRGEIPGRFETVNESRENLKKNGL